MKEYIKSLHQSLVQLDNVWGGDICFIPPVKEEVLKKFESSIGWSLPVVFHHFYTQEANGIIIDNKRIYGLYDNSQKKTFVENLERMNDPETSFWFKGRRQIFNDYLVIGYDSSVIFCLSKKYDIPNPSVYLCNNPNSSAGVDFKKIDLDLESLINEMAKQAFDV